jgi:hypothetical protein
MHNKTGKLLASLMWNERMSCMWNVCRHVCDWDHMSGSECSKWQRTTTKTAPKSRYAQMRMGKLRVAIRVQHWPQSIGFQNQSQLIMEFVWNAVPVSLKGPPFSAYSGLAELDVFDPRRFFLLLWDCIRLIAFSSVTSSSASCWALLTCFALC